MSIWKSPQDKLMALEMALRIMKQISPDNEYEKGQTEMARDLLQVFFKEPDPAQLELFPPNCS